ncbi:MAG: PEGA domain-containing protein [Deltaproteobacteria bacterium]|nr:PEGA domain-containing protein [Deltaproteobacteria bacterium]
MRFGLFVAVVLSSVGFGFGGARAEDGLLTVSVGIPIDSGSARAAVQVATAAREAIAADTALTVIDLEALLDATDAPPAAARITEARRLKDKADLGLSMVDLPVAADAYATALVAFEQGAAALTNINEVVDTLEKQATTFALQGETASAKQSYDKALALDPGFRLAADAPPRAKKIFDDVVKGWRTPPMGQLTVYATTGAAEVWVDGVPRGASPLTLDVPAGRHLVRVYREGYRAWGGAVDVKKGSESTAQAALKPTAGFAKLDELLGRLSRNPENAQNVSDVVRFLKVDRVLLTLVEVQGPIANVSGFYVDGVSGRTLRKGQKSLSVDGNFFERDTTTFVRERFLQGQNLGSIDDPVKVEVPVDRRRGPSRLPGEAEKVETPGMVIAGWVTLSTAIVPLATGIVLGVVTLNQNEAFHSRDQVDPELEQIKSAWLFTSVGADVGMVVGAGMIATGAVLLVNGYSEQAALEDVMEPGR